MSISFEGLNNNTLDLNNGRASRILKAIGYEVSEESSGSMPIDAALAGLEVAIVSEEDRESLAYLFKMALEIKAAGGTELTWS